MPATTGSDRVHAYIDVFGHVVTFWARCKGRSGIVVAMVVLWMGKGESMSISYSIRLLSFIPRNSRLCRLSDSVHKNVSYS